MKTKKLPKFWLAITVTTLWGGILVSGAFAAETVRQDAFHAANGVSCDDCHGDTAQRMAVPMVKCLECHDTEDLAAKTKDVKPTNPHKNRHYDTEADCNLCHHQHRKSENFCLPCHGRFAFLVP